jgi:glycosyltransferase involved in cell wall biosynthesis
VWRRIKRERRFAPHPARVYPIADYHVFFQEIDIRNYQLRIQLLWGEQVFALQVAILKGDGGILTSVIQFARMCDSVGVKSICLYRGPSSDKLRREGVDFIPAPPSLTSPFFVLLPDVSRLRNQIRKYAGQDPDYINVHSDLALRNMRRLYPASILLTQCHSDKTKRKHNADIVLTLNPDQHEKVTRELAKSHAQTFMLGHPFSIPTVVPPHNAGPIRINYVARLVAAKDPLTLVRAVAKLKTRQYPELRFIGDGPLQVKVQKIASSLGTKAEFSGWRSSPFDDFTSNDILVLPSKWEGLPWLLLEAQARGIPTIASNIAGNALALGGGAYGDLFEMGDADSLARKLDAAVNDLSNLQKKAKQGQIQLEKRFGPQIFWDGLQRAIQSVKSEQGVCRND